MTVFISYARANQAAAEQLRADVERCHRDAWVDQELTGGQSWWLAILDHIRRCDVFLVVLSPQWVRSKACDLELRYAVALGRPVLPVMVAKVDPRLAQPAVADAQILGYLERSAEATFALRDALDALPATPPLPSPLPPEPAAPISYLHNVLLMLNSAALEPDAQRTLWAQLRAALDETDGDELPELLDLVRRFRRRPDLPPELRVELDEVLAPAPASGSPAATPANPPARSRRRLLWSAAAAVVAVIVAVSVWLAVTDRGGGRDPAGSTTSSNPAAATFTVPSLWMSRADEADLALRSVGWTGTTLNRTEVPVTDPAQDGVVLKVDPPAGKEVPADAEVTVTVGVYERP